MAFTAQMFETAQDLMAYVNRHATTRTGIQYQGRYVAVTTALARILQERGVPFAYVTSGQHGDLVDAVLVNDDQAA